MLTFPPNLTFSPYRCSAWCSLICQSIINFWHNPIECQPIPMASVGILVLVQTAGPSLVQTVVGTPSCYGKKAPHGMLNTVSKRLYYAGSNRFPKVHAINVPPLVYPPTPPPLRSFSGQRCFPWSVWGEVWPPAQSWSDVHGQGYLGQAQYQIQNPERDPPHLHLLFLLLLQTLPLTNPFTLQLILLPSQLILLLILLFKICTRNISYLAHPPSTILQNTL